MLTDLAVFHAIANNERGDHADLWLFYNLYRGKKVDPHKRSEADFELAKLFCRYTPDDEQVIRLMAGSALARDKWQDRRGPVSLLRHTVNCARKKVTYDAVSEFVDFATTQRETA
jgi:hypothetical protein